MNIGQWPVWLRAAVVLALFGSAYAVIRVARGAKLGAPCRVPGDCGVEGVMCTTDGYCTIACRSDDDCGPEMRCQMARAGDSAEQLRDGFFRRDLRACMRPT